MGELISIGEPPPFAFGKSLGPLRIFLPLATALFALLVAIQTKSVHVGLIHAPSIGTKRDGQRLVEQPLSVPSVAEPSMQPSTSKPTLQPNLAAPGPPALPPAAPVQTVYTRARTDRTGMQLYELTCLSAMVFYSNERLGGVCEDAVDWQGHADVHNFTLEEVMLHHEKRKEKEKRAIASLGLENFFRFACPTQEELGTKQAKIMNHRTHFKNRDLYATEAWLADFRNHSTLYHDIQSALPAPSARPLNVAVHIRRGDLNPCSRPERYLTNEYYLQVMDEIVHPKFCTTKDSCNITVFTEKVARMENHDVFLQRNYTVDLNSTLETIWQDFVKADILVISVSTFSYVPALLNPNVVIRPPFMGNLHPWPGWLGLSQEVWELVQKPAMERLRAAHCNGTTPVNVSKFEYDWERR